MLILVTNGVQAPNFARTAVFVTNTPSEEDWRYAASARLWTLQPRKILVTLI
jgi:hypothetical protein